MYKILFATSEVYPLIKTGGLADVASSLPRALLKLGHDIKILVPAYASIMSKAKELGIKKLTEITLDAQVISLWKTRLPGSRVNVILVDIPSFSEREGNPYCGPDGADWPDNHLRFYGFSKAAEAISLNQANLDWQPDIVHCNDWQTALIPALLSEHPQKPASVFTIHNLAYRGLFSREVFNALKLSENYWHPNQLEFYGQMSFIKGGLAFANAITTVSPSYAQEIQTATFGCGLEGLLRARSADLNGILNGIDMDEWNPGTDKLISQNFNRRTLAQKVKNKTTLQEKLGLPISESTPVFGFIGRLVDQKGIELLLAQMDEMLLEDCQLVVLGSGFSNYESALLQIAKANPNKVSVTIGYSETLAHQIEASADVFLMPSLFEPCGLNQMYSLRYGTLPIVNSVGGLKDTVSERPMDDIGTEGNGFVFHNPTSEDLQATIKRAITYYQHPEIWKKLQQNAMSKDFSWEQSALRYQEIYSDIQQ
jgi:starch synthase